MKIGGLCFCAALLVGAVCSVAFARVDYRSKTPIPVTGPGTDDGEFMIDTSFAPMPEPHDQQSPSVASDGVDYLTVWMDARDSASQPNIYAARVDHSGRVLDADSGIAVALAADSQAVPAAAFGGGVYLVVWEDKRGGDRDIYGARVTQTGVLLDPNGIVICAATNSQWDPAVASDGTSFLVVWSDERSAVANIYGARVSQSGTVLDPGGIAISTADLQEKPSVAFGAGYYMVVWEDERNDDCDIYGSRVSPSGQVIDPGGIAVSTSWDDQYSPSVAFDGANFLAVWEDWRNGNDADVYCARVTPSAQVLDPGGIAVSTAINDQTEPSIAFDGTHYLAAWTDMRGGTDPAAYGARVSPAGAVLDPAGIPVTVAQTPSEVTSSSASGNTLVVWTAPGDAYLEHDVLASRVNISGSVLDSLGIIVSSVMGAAEQYGAVVAFDGTDYLVVWPDSQYETGWDIRGARVNPSGTVLDPAGFTISAGAGDQDDPAIAFDGANFLVVWFDDRGGIYGARVTPEGAVLDPNGFVVSHAAYRPPTQPTLAFDGTNFLAVWRDNRNSVSSDIYGARVSRSGVCLDPNGIAVCTAPGKQSNPAVSFGRDAFLAVWQDTGRGGSTGNDIYAARVDTNGVVLDTEGIAVTASLDNERHAAVAFDGINYLTAWSDKRSGHHTAIYGARVTQDGAVLDSGGLPISQFAEPPSMLFDGADYVLVWADSIVRGVKVEPSGVVVDSFLVTSHYGVTYYAAIAQGLQGQFLIAYDYLTGVSQGRTYDTQRIWGKFYPFGGIAERQVASLLEQQPIVVTPNPSKGVFVVRSPSAVAGIKVYDVAGALVKEERYGPTDLRKDHFINLEGTEAGVYLLRVETGGREASLKLVVE
jgi:hypothetical protein